MSRKQLIKSETLQMAFFDMGGNGKNMVKEKYKQLRLALQFGGINTIGYTRTLVHMQK